MVLVVSNYNLPEPATDLARTMMLPALKLSLHGFQLRDHPLFRRDSPDDESSVGELPTKVGEAQESEGLWFSLSAPLPVSSGKAPVRSVVSCPIRTGDLLPLLLGNYPGSKLLRSSPPLVCALVLSGSLGFRLRLFPYQSQTKFSSSVRKPRLESRPLYTGHRAASK